MAIIQYQDVGSSPFLAPEENSYSWKFWRVAAFDHDSVTLKMGTERVVLRGAAELATLSVGFDFEQMTAEQLVSKYEFDQFLARSRRRRTTSPVQNRFDAEDLGRFPFLNEFDVIDRDLQGRGFESDQIEHYARQLLKPKTDATFFWPGRDTAKDEYRKIQRGLHETKLVGLSAATRDFAKELYKLATSAARSLRGFSERR